MPVRVSVEAWRTHGAEVVHFAGAELVDSLFRLYAYLDRFEREPRLMRPTVHQDMREAAVQLEKLARRSWRDRALLL